MSLRHLAKIIGAAVVPTTNSIDGSGDNDNDNDNDNHANGDPSKKKPSTFTVVVRNSIWFFRTVHGQFWYALGYAFVDSRRLSRKTFALLMNVVGFAYSVGVELLLTSRNEYKNQWFPLVEELNLFLQTSGIAVELERGFANYRFLSNVAILARIQDTILIKRGATGVPSDLDRRYIASLERNSNKEKLPQRQRTSIIEEGRRFMRYTTAAYGISMIDAAEIDVYGSVQTSKTKPSSTAIATSSNLLLSLKSSLTFSQQKRQLQSSSSSFYDQDWLLGRISEHIDIPEEDIFLMNLLDDQVETLRFFIAVDHTNKAVVLSIRGSLTVKEILIDIAGFSRPFCGGEAHSEMANTAETIWDAAKDMITKLLCENADHELVLTGHSLGAGAAALLNILLHENNRKKVNGRAIRCFAYASPPVFAGEVAEETSEACINYIHDTDVVPFLSVDSVRRIFAALHAIEECNLGVWIRSLIIWGSTEVIHLSTLLRVESALHDPLPVKKGAPELLIPAHMNVWMRTIAPNLPKDLNTEELAELNPFSPSDFVLADSAKLARMGVSFDPSMITNHFPNGYESALHNLQ